MADEKKYFWLRLKRDFFKRHDIRIIESMPNGKDYLLFYLKLLCESVDHEGTLRFNNEIPYSESMLSIITNTNVDIVKCAIKVFTELGMMELLDDGTYFMSEVDKMIGSSVQDEYTRESTRLRVKAYRERQKALQNAEKCYSNATCNGEIEKEIDIELDTKENNNNKNIVVKEKSTRSRFSPPTIEEVESYIKEYSLEKYNVKKPLIDAQDFIDYYQSNGWKVSRETMKDYKATIRRWIRKKVEDDPSLIDEEDENAGFRML